MFKTPQNSSNNKGRPLASIKWLKYLGIVFLILCVHTVAIFYYKYGGDIFAKSLTIGQYIKISLYSIGSVLTALFAPMLFYSGALLYRSVRLKRMNPLSAIKRDFLILIPLGLTIWLYCAFIDAPVKGKFYAMLWQIQELQEGKKLKQNPSMYKLMEGPNLSGFYNKIDSLNVEIKFEKNKTEDKLNSDSSTLNYIKELKNKKHNYQNEINNIYFTPIYCLLILLLGMLLGYLIPLHKMALIGILIIIGYIWKYSIYFLEITLDNYNPSNLALLFIKMGMLIIINIVLIIILKKVYIPQKD